MASIIRESICEYALKECDYTSLEYDLATYYPGKYTISESLSDIDELISLANTMRFDYECGEDSIYHNFDIMNLQICIERLKDRKHYLEDLQIMVENFQYFTEHTVPTMYKAVYSYDIGKFKDGLLPLQCIDFIDELLQFLTALKNSSLNKNKNKALNFYNEAIKCCEDKKYVLLGSIDDNSTNFFSN